MAKLNHNSQRRPGIPSAASAHIAPSSSSSAADVATVLLPLCCCYCCRCSSNIHVDNSDNKNNGWGNICGMCREKLLQMNNPQLCVGAQIAIVACSQSRNESLHELGSGKLFVRQSRT